MRWTVVLLLVGCVASALAACGSGERVVSDDLATYDLPGYAREPPFTSVSDWRRLVRPTQAMRDHFEPGGTYRVVSAQRDRVTLVVWKTDSPYGQPFDGGEAATGHACVTLRRTPAVRADVVACPAHLGPRPQTYQTSWGRDSNAVASAASGVTFVDLEVTAYAVPAPYQRPATHTRAELLAAMRRTRMPSGGRLTVALAPRQAPGRLRAVGSIHAIGSDAVDVTRTATTHECFVVDMALSGRVPTSVTTTVPCR